jgi:hypothetical protein
VYTAQNSPGRLSDGPGDYGNYTFGETVGMQIAVLKATFSDMIMTMTFKEAEFQSLRQDTWFVGGRVRFFPEKTSVPEIQELVCVCVCVCVCE